MIVHFSAHISKWELVCKFGVIFHIFIISCLCSRFHVRNQWFFYSVITFSYTKCFVHSYTVDVVFTLSYGMLTLWPSDAISWQRSGSILAPIMACYSRHFSRYGRFVRGFRIPYWIHGMDLPIFFRTTWLTLGSYNRMKASVPGNVDKNDFYQPQQNTKRLEPYSQFMGCILHVMLFS